MITRRLKERYSQVRSGYKTDEKEPLILKKSR